MMETRGLVKGEYLPWDRVFRLKPLRPELSHLDWWTGLKFARATGMRPLPLNAAGDGTFGFNLIDHVIAMLHKIDQMASGSIQIDERVTNPATRDRYVINSLIEEA